MIERLAPEQHDTLDEVPEPAENPALVGHGEAQQVLLAAQAAGRLPHAVVLAGPQGIGKATFAFHFARHLLSGSAGGERFADVDPHSALFRQVASGAHPSVLHLTRPANAKGAGFKTVLAVDEIRRIGQFLSLTAPDGAWRVVIVDPADDLRASAANALLKNLEEPPAATVFILICHVAGRLMPTIRSRCQVIRLGPLDETDLAQVLDRVGGVPPGDRAELLRRADGSVRRAIMLHQHGGLEIVSALDEVLRSPGDVRTQHRLADAVSGRDRASQFAMFNDHALSVLADAAGNALRSGDGRRAKRLADTWQEARIAISDTEIYNLDQKQHALTMIGRLNRALAGDARRM